MTISSGRQHDSGDSSVYGLEVPLDRRPDLPGQVVVRPSVDELIDALAANLVVHAENCVRQFGDFHLALSGGPEFDGLYRRLMYDPNYRRLPWRRTHLWLVAEHGVGFDRPESTVRQISETIGDHADIPSEQFHPIFAEAETADADYEVALRDALSWREKGQDRLDYVLLSPARDGGTGVLRPGGAVVDAERMVWRDVTADPVRVGLTSSFIRASRLVAIYATGAEQAPLVSRIADDEGLDDLPIAAMAPYEGELHWYLDGAATRG